MALTKYKLGDLIEPCDERNLEGRYTIEDLRGISTGKEFIDTKANMDGVSISSYKVVNGREFAYVADTSRRGEKIAVAFNSDDKPLLISSIYTVFRVKRTDLLFSDYLFMYFNRPEFDRYARFNSWGSARETFDWDTMCDIDIELPDLPTQQKYVDIYKAMVANQQCYERGLEDLKLVCDGYIEDLRRNHPCKKIGPYIAIRNEQNSNMEFSSQEVLGVSQEKLIIPTKANTENNDLSKFTVIYPDDFVYNPRNGVAVALNKIKAIISWNNTAFYIKNKDLIPEYLMLWLSRKEWDRKVKFDSWGSSTEVYSFESLCETKIPIPDVNIQQSIANIYNIYSRRKEINEQLKAQIKDICPILIKGSLEEGK